jgi:CO/xanthine dehydrogenase FAD-binding subunit
MKPAPFAYAAPGGLAEALTLISDYGADGKVLAGGQSLVPLLAMRLARPAVLIDLNRVRQLDYIRAGAEVRIGAMTRQRAAELSPVVRRRLPLLAEALAYIGHPQIRNRGTIGGTLAHADPAAELPAVLAALDGRVVLRSSRGTRTLGPEEFFVSYLTTALEPDELLVEVRLPAHDHMGSAFVEVARRHGDYALVGVAAVVEVNDGRIVRTRLAFTGVGAVPVRIPELEQALAGRILDEAVLTEAGRIASARVDPEGDIHASAEYRRELAGVLTERALRLAVDRAKGRRARRSPAGQKPATPADGETSP